MYKDTTWTRIADFPGTERYGAVAFVLGNIAYVGTGYTPSTKNRADEFIMISMPMTHRPVNGATLR